jgi:sulfate transport system ATP-binding protein
VNYLELRGVNKTFGDFKASDDANLTVEKGMLIGLLGPSGSGKTTILRMIAGLETPDSGDIIINGVRVNDLDASRRGIGFVFQNYALFRYMSVFDNIAFGLKVKRERPDIIKSRVNELIALVGLDGLEKRYPNQLSGGQRQRVAIARAIALNPAALLCDEPTSALDPETTDDILSLLKDLNSRLGITIVIITHETRVVEAICDRVATIENGKITNVSDAANDVKRRREHF